MTDVDLFEEGDYLMLTYMTTATNSADVVYYFSSEGVEKKSVKEVAIELIKEQPFY